MKPSNPTPRGRPRARPTERTDLFDAAQVAALRAPVNGGESGDSSISMRLARLLRTAIVDGKLKTGEGLPPERELAERFQVSRDTVRRAIDKLTRQGLIESRRGAGTFVAARVEQQLSLITSFSDDMQRRGLKPGSQWLRRELDRPSPDELLALGLGPDARVIRLERVRTADAVPMAIERATLPADLLRDTVDFGESLYRALQDADVRPVRAIQRLRAELASARDAELLGINAGDPVLSIERRSFSSEGCPLELTCSLYRGDRYDYVAVLDND
ncbi:GntR family transcriptional regulator [Burkholderia stagnalis]|uniref:GntR family transcriptional regulator n=1 Tax=Burkholderia stagnalis TaxID=1503054 RepID=UPI0009C1999A|nr:GntR family transcriptional regulator [Burkholderia stagnalis]